MSIFTADLYTEEEEAYILNELGSDYIFTEDDRLKDTTTGEVQGKYGGTMLITSEDQTIGGGYGTNFFNGKHGGADETINEFLSRNYVLKDYFNAMSGIAANLTKTFWSGISEAAKTIEINISLNQESLDNFTDTVDSITEILPEIADTVIEGIDKSVEVAEFSTEVVVETIEIVEDGIDIVGEIVEEIGEFVIDHTSAYNNDIFNEIEKFYDSVFNILGMLLKLLETLTSMEELLTIIPFLLILFVSLKVLKSVS